MLPRYRLQIETQMTLDDGTVVTEHEELKEQLADGGSVPFFQVGLTGTRLDLVFSEKGGDRIP
jgi:hypothetical protein